MVDTQPHALFLSPPKEMHGDWDFDAMSSVVSLDQVMKYPSFPWVVEGLSRNPNITVPFLQEIDHDRLLPWNWTSVTAAIDPSEILLHPGFPWTRRGLSRNPKLTVTFIRIFDQHPECFKEDTTSDPWDWSEISYRASERDVISYPNLPWVIGLDVVNFYLNPAGPCLSNNPGLTATMIVVLGEEKPGWDWPSISRRVNAREVLEHPGLPWDLPSLRSNPTMTPGVFFDLEEELGVDEDEMVEDEEVRTLIIGQHRPEWNRYHLSQNLTLTLSYMIWFDEVTGYNETDRNRSHWDLPAVTRNLTPAELYAGRLTYEWDPFELTTRPDIIELIRADPGWIRLYISVFDVPGIQLRDVYIRPNLPWSRQALSRNPDITPLDVRHIDTLSHHVRVPGIPIGSGFTDARVR